jgi:hypothetical protein
MITNEKKIVKKGEFLDNQFVDEVIRSYKQDKWVYNSQRIGKEDSLTAWTSVEEMEELIERIKMYGGNGIRICFAAYPQDHTENPELAGRQTVVMVATKQSETGSGNKDLYVSDGKKAKILAFGKMPTCPPWCLSYTAQNNPQLGTALVDRGEIGISVI